MTHIEALRDLGACNPGVRYASTHATAQEAWDACRRPGWLAWLVARIDRRQGALIACLCARSVVHRSGRYQTEIESLLGQIEAWAWGADLDLAPVRSRLWAIFAADATAYAAAAAAATAYADDDAADAAASAATAYAAYDAADPTDLCDLIRSAVPRCPLEVAS